MRTYLAIDIGASSGRHILGWKRDGRIELREIYRFENNIVERDGALLWDIDALFGHVVAGLRACKDTGTVPETVGIDTWGVDFVLLDQSGQRIGDAMSYRDSRTTDAAAQVERLLPFSELYRRTGIQKLQFNTVYQLWTLQRDRPEDLRRSAHLLMIPDYLNYLLTGKMRQEYTNATTTGLVDAEAKKWDLALIAKLGYPTKLFGPLSMPGTVVGSLSPDIAAKAGFQCRVVLPATHDTGSAFLAVPTSRDDAVTLSSGTWSLLGVESLAPITTEAAQNANITNEGGYDYRFRVLKNIMGLWMLQSIRRCCDNRYSFAELELMAKERSAFSGIVDVRDNRFLAPENMLEEVRRACRDRGQPVPADVGETVQCVYKSLAICYADTVRRIAALTGKTYIGIHIVGGGCKDGYLNQLTANCTGLPVSAGPVEATAIGNLIAQMIAGGEFPDLVAARAAVAESFEIQYYSPNEV